MRNAVASSGRNTANPRPVAALKIGGIETKPHAANGAVRIRLPVGQNRTGVRRSAPQEIYLFVDIARAAVIAPLQPSDT